MFLKSVTELSVDFDEVRAAMLRRPYGWLDDLAYAAGADGDRLLVEVGLEVRGPQVSRRARIDVGEPLTADRIASLPLRLGVEDHERLFPALEGSLDAAWLGSGRTHLALTAQYEPPFGLVGKAVDRALLHRVAEAVAQRFLEAVAQRLVARPASNGPDPGTVRWRTEPGRWLLPLQARVLRPWAVFRAADRLGLCKSERLSTPASCGQRPPSRW